MQHTIGKSSWQGLQLVSDPISIKGLHTILWAPKIARIPTLGISGLPLGSFETKWHLGAGPVVGTKYTIRGNVVASPKSGSWWVLWIHACPWIVHALKCSKYALTNLLFGSCRSVWVIKFLVNLLNPILELQHAPLPPKCCELGNAPWLLILPMSSPLDL
jgi:hypothetical protein